MRKCSKCKTLFTPIRKIQYLCKDCIKLKDLDRRQRNRERWATQNPYEVHKTGIKKCGMCKQGKSVNEYSVDRVANDGLQYRCRKCAVRDFQIRKYGIALLENVFCQICGRTDKIGIDHCHDTNKIRGFLCRDCNFGISSFKDNPELIDKAIRYLVKNG